jgi:hypothetical protein
VSRTEVLQPLLITTSQASLVLLRNRERILKELEIETLQEIAWVQDIRSKAPHWKRFERKWFWHNLHRYSPAISLEGVGKPPQKSQVKLSGVSARDWN